MSHTWCVLLLLRLLLFAFAGAVALAKASVTATRNEAWRLGWCHAVATYKKIPRLHHMSHGALRRKFTSSAALPPPLFEQGLNRMSVPHASDCVRLFQPAAVTLKNLHP